MQAASIFASNCIEDEENRNKNYFMLPASKKQIHKEVTTN